MIYRGTTFGRTLTAIFAAVALGASGVREAGAALAAYEGFDYTPQLLINGGVGLNGGTGWAGAWDNDTAAASDSTNVEAGSLTYTDSLGNVLQTTGGRLRNTGMSGIANIPGRTLAVRHAASGTPKSSWISFLGVREGALNDSNGTLEDNTYGRGANLSLFDTTQLDGAEKFNMGENSNYQFPVVDGHAFLTMQATDPSQTELFKRTYGISGTLATKAEDRWMFSTPRVAAGITALANPPVTVDGVPITSNREYQPSPWDGRFQRAFSDTPFASQTSLVLVRIDHSADPLTGRDKALVWMNPKLDAVPPDALADVVMDLAAFEARATEINNAGGTVVPFSGVEGALLSFDRFRLFAGNEALPRKLADWLVDEIRLGDTFGDVTPHTGPAAAGAVPEPGALALAGVGIAVLRRRGRGRR